MTRSNLLMAVLIALLIFLVNDSALAQKPCPFRAPVGESGLRKQKATKKVKPIYPEASLKNNVAGRVVVEILVDENGKEVTEKDEHGLLKGNLCMKAPWPGILRTTWGDHERCRQNYFATYPDLYFTGDGALKDEKGNAVVLRGMSFGWHNWWPRFYNAGTVQ